MTPQELINLPGYGRAREYLIDQGQCNDPKLVMEKRARRIMFLSEQLVE